MGFAYFEYSLWLPVRLLLVSRNPQQYNSFWLEHNVILFGEGATVQFRIYNVCLVESGRPTCVDGAVVSLFDTHKTLE